MYDWSISSWAGYELLWSMFVVEFEFFFGITDQT